jgi:hypothetical protein
MILTADSDIASRTNKRRANEGWNTLFIGANRFTKKPDEPTPDEATLFPVAFLVEKEPGAVVRPHFHQAEQFQIVVGGGGKFGVHDVDGIVVHYTGPYTAYGPLVASDKGLDWFTLRNGWDPGARYMPAERVGLREGRARHAHREATAEVREVFTERELARLTHSTDENILPEAEDGVAAWRYRLAPGATLIGPEPGVGGGQFWVILAGTMSAIGDTLLPAKSCVFVPPDDPSLIPTAGPEGAEVLCLQFAARPRH